ncbi:hypothetical protein [Spirillospora sp. NPDC047279]|uniref:hypothetical protein n=1 Tax=Spirillospora sp. NPDC047279 TaxID=3155478 RepID=UPI0033DDC271
MTEAVRFAGGWAFDLAMAGWGVTVLTAERADARPLRILGAGVLELDPVLAAPSRRTCPQALAVCGDLYGSDPRVRRMVRKAAGEGGADVRLWASDVGAGVVRHRLSVAARAFKAQALAAAAVPEPPADNTEMFWRGDLLGVS